ncbi:MAG TPA: sulfurtransferase TusA family protein [Allosphingosinicella sp.]|jgi:tRNA 2-thiouridine synthesizing protein A
MSEPLLVDARGLRCPWPVIRLGRAAREMNGPGRIRILADDPIAPGEIAALCAERGWACAVDPEVPHAYEIAISQET